MKRARNASSSAFMTRLKMYRGYLLPLGILTFLLISNFFTEIDFFRSRLMPNTIQLEIYRERGDEMFGADMVGTTLQYPAERSDAVCRDQFDRAVSYFQRKRYADAKTIWQKILADNCLESAAANNIALAEERQGRLNTAGQWYSRALAFDSSNTAAWYNRACLNIELTRYSSARDDLARLLALQPAHPPGLFNLGQLFIHMSHPDSALLYYHKAREWGHNDASIAFKIGLAYHKLDLLDSAMVWYDEAVRFRPAFVEPRYNAALLLKEHKEYGKARDYLKKLLKINPDNLSALLLYSRIEVELERYKSAGRYLNRLLRKAPEHVDALYEYARVLGLQGFDNQAIDVYRKISSFDPSNPRVYYNIGVNMMDLGRPQEAVAAYRQALDLDPFYWKAAYNLGVHYLKEEQDSTAINLFQHTISVHEDHIESRYNLGLAHMRLHRYVDALDAFRDAITLDSTHTNSRYNMGLVLIDLKALDSAEVVLKSLLRQEPRHYKSAFTLGVLERKREQYQPAIDWFQRAIAIRSKYPEAWYNTALCYRDLKKYNQALDAIDAALELRKDYTGALVLRADILERSGQSDLAVATLIQAYENDSTNIELIRELAEPLMEIGNPEEARLMLRRAIAFDSTDISLLANLARLETRLGEYDSAAMHYKRLIEYEQDLGKNLMNLAKVLIADSKTRNARRVLIRLINHQPDNLEARQTLVELYEKRNMRRNAAKQREAIYRLTGTYEAAENAGFAYMRADNYEQAADMFRTARDIDSTHWNAWYYGALMITRLEDFEAATRAWMEFTHHYPEDSRGWYQLGKIAVDRQNFKKAREWLQKSVGIKDDNNAWYYLALSLYNLNHFDEAYTALKSFLEIEPDSRRGNRLQRRIERKLS